MASLAESLDELRAEFRLGCAQLEARLEELQRVATQQAECFESTKALRDEAVMEADRLRCENNALRERIAALQARS